MDFLTMQSTHNNPVLKIVFAAIIIVLPIFGFAFGIQYSALVRQTTVDQNKITQSQKTYTSILWVLWQDPYGQNKLFTKTNPLTHSGDLYNTYLDYTPSGRMIPKTVKVLDIGSQLPGLNFHNPLWNNDGSKFIQQMSMGDSSKTYLCYKTGNPAVKLDLQRSFKIEERIISWLDNEKVLGSQLVYKDSIKTDLDRVPLPENYTIKYWIAPVTDLNQKKFISF